MEKGLDIFTALDMGITNKTFELPMNRPDS